MRARTFHLLCIASIIAAGALAIAVVETGPNSDAPLIPGLDGSGGPIFQPLDLTLSLVILFDFGLMVVALVWLFKDDPEPRPPE